MIGWTNQVENKLLNFQEKKYNSKINNKSDDFIFTKKCKPFVVFLGFCFVIVNLVSMILVCVALLSTKIVPIQSDKNENTSASLLWDYSPIGNGVVGQQSINYSLSIYGITTVIFVVLSIILLISFTYAWFRDDLFISLDKKSKRLWVSLCVSWTIGYLIFLIVTAIGVSIISSTLYPSNFDDAKPSSQFGLIFYILDNSKTNIVLGISSFGIFVVVLQFVLLFSSIFWFIIFNFNVNLKKLKSLFSFKENKKSK